MNRLSILSFFVLLLIFVCCEKEKSGLIDIPVDISQNSPIPLSEIADKIRTVELEFTDKSMIGDWYRHNRILTFEKHIVFLDGHVQQILLFDNTGKFLNTIGKRGLGPGEFTVINDIAVNEEMKYIYISSNNKIICYNFGNKLINEIQFENINEYLLYTNDLLIAISTQMQQDNNQKYRKKTYLYYLDQNLIKKDSLLISNTDADKYLHISTLEKNYISTYNNDNYLYYPLIAPGMPSDTLYHITPKAITPYSKLNFHNGAIASSNDPYKRIIYYIYKSSRFIFCKYDPRKEDGVYYFCYDTYKEKAYNSNEGYLDDIHSGMKVRIYPLSHDSNTFYYLLHKEDEESEEHNPTLYIGTFKQ